MSIIEKYEKKLEMKLFKRLSILVNVARIP